jgi:hypothetical protein
MEGLKWAMDEDLLDSDYNAERRDFSYPRPYASGSRGD